MEEGASQALTFIHLILCQLKRAPPAWVALEDKERPKGVIGIEGGEYHHNGEHRRSLLI